MRWMVIEGLMLAVDHPGSESVIDNNLDSALPATSVSGLLHRYAEVFGALQCLPGCSIGQMSMYEIYGRRSLPLLISRLLNHPR